MIAVSKGTIYTFLFMCFHLAYILTPYWKFAPTLRLSLFFLIFSVLSGSLWAYWCSDGVIIRLSRTGAMQAVVCIIVLFLLNFRALISEFEWSGDEEYHILGSMLLANRLKRFIIALAFLYCIAWIVFNRISHKNLSAFFAISTLVVVIPSLWFDISDLRRDWMIRYPVLGRYAFAVPVVVVCRFFRQTPEFFFRVIPLLSTAVLGFCTARSLRDTHPIGRLLLAFCIATVPLVYYYSSILYLEMPAVALLTIAWLDAPALLSLPLSNVRTRGTWYALLLVGFIKETTVAVIAAFIMCRYIVRFFYGRQKVTARTLKEEIFFGAALIFPLVVYLWYRHFYGNPRPLMMQWENFVNPDSYRTLCASYPAQFGLMGMTGLAGIGAMIAKKKYGYAALCCTAWLADASLHLLDDRQYLGYGRFNLFMVPMACAATIFLFNSMNRMLRYVAIGVWAALIPQQMRLSGVHADGSRRHTYPYRAAMRWIGENNTCQRLRFTGMDYRYDLIWYYTPAEVHVDASLTDMTLDERTAIETALCDAARAGFSCVLYQLRHRSLPDSLRLNGFRVNKIFSNAENSLVLFTASDLAGE